MTGMPPAVRIEHTALLEEGRLQALALLRRNLTPHGILASSPTPAAAARGYACVFARDAAICALAMALTDDTVLHDGAWRSLETLARHQAANGQIPKFVDPQQQDSDFWYVGCIDATLWWLVALDFLSLHRPDAPRRAALEGNARRALAWLHCQEHPRLNLLTQNEASDWADIMPRSGFVLYSNALWYRVKRRYGLPDAARTRHHFNHLFHPFSRDLPEYRRLRLLTHYVRRAAKHRDLYLSFVNFSFFGEEGDVLGNLLAILFGLAEEAQAARILHVLRRNRIDEPQPVRVTLAPIRQGDPLWRPYMGRHRQNLEYQYHNGGAWPFVGGFWVMALAARGQRREAVGALVKLVEANRLGDWAFTEWFHGKRGTSAGMRGQSWNAATLLLAQRALTTRIF